MIKLKEYSEDLLDVKGIIVSTETGRIYPLGMFLGVPFFATVQFLIGNWVDYRLYKKNIKLEKEALNEKMDRWVYLNDLAEQIANQ